MVQIMSRTIQPLGSKVVLEKIQIPAQMQNGIMLPDQTTRSNRYRVVAVGPKTTDLLPEMIVRCDRSEGDLVTLDNKVYRVVEEKNILAVEDF
jgi:co-chaperonin GroES (HSP10)